MSKNLPKRILDSLLKIEKKIVTYPLEDKFKKMRDEYQNQKENRELVVVDKYGNKYYQYYSSQGVPSRRFVNLNMISFNNWNDDIIMKAWLERRREIPPTQEELEQMYIEHEEFQRRGLEWDKQEQKQLEEFRKKQTEKIDADRQETGAIGDGSTYEPGKWDRNISKGNDLLVVNENKELQVIEGTSTIPGKYHMEMLDDAMEYYRKKHEKQMQPYVEMSKLIVWSDYTPEKMSDKYKKDLSDKREELKKTKQELTNLGKRMLEKGEELKGYSEFRHRFKDVFDEFNN